MNKSKKIHFIIYSIILFYLILFCYFGVKVTQYPFLGIKLIPTGSHWMVESTMSTGIGKELGVKPGELIYFSGGEGQRNRYVSSKWLILEQVHSFSVGSLGKIIHFKVPAEGKHNIVPYFIMTILSLIFLALGLVIYYKKYYLYYSKYFLLFNLGMSFVLLSAVPSNLGFLVGRILFCLGLIWISYFLVKFILLFPISITDSWIARKTGSVFFIIAVGFTIFVFYHLIFELPFFLIKFLIKGIFLPAFLSLIAISLLLAFVSLRKVDVRNRYQVKLLLYCTLLSYLPTIIFYVIPTICHFNEVSFVSTAFFLFLFPFICTYLFLEKGNLNFRMAVPNSIIQFLYSLVVVLTFFLLYSFQEKTGHTALVLLFYFLFFWGIQTAYSYLIAWNTARNYSRKENDQNTAELLLQYKQNYHVAEILEFVLNEFSRMIDAKGSIIVWLSHFHTVCICSSELEELFTNGIRINRQGKLSIQQDIQSKVSEQVSITYQNEVLGYLLIFGGIDQEKRNRVLIEKFTNQISMFLYSIKELDGIESEYFNRLNMADELSTNGHPIDMNEDYFLIEKLEEEKEKISQYLHDSIIQNLIFVLRGLKDLRGSQKPADKKRIDDMLGNFENTLFDLRNLCFDLYPSLVEDLGFKKAIDYLIREVHLRSDVMITSEYETFVENELPLDLKLASFRMVKELVNNVLKHAGANKLDLSFIMEEDVFIIKVEDDGIGLDISDFQKNITKNKRYGIVSIKRKINYLQGNFDIYRNRWNGTTFVLTIPNTKKDGSMNERAN